jgi:hypothetical protein
MNSIEELVSAAPPILTDKEIRHLNRARSILETAAKSCQHAAWDAPTYERGAATKADYGRVQAMSIVAADAIFQALNWANSYRVRPLTDEQLHNQ